MEISEIHKQLEIFKSTYRPDFHSNQWRAKALQALAVKQKQLKELKEFRKFANVAANNQELQIFAKLVKEAIPEELYIRLWQQAEETMKYNTYDTAIQRYSNIPDGIREKE